MPTNINKHKKIDVYFADQYPQVPYINIRIFELNGYDFNELVQEAKNYAAAEGYDAIKILTNDKSYVLSHRNYPFNNYNHYTIRSQIIMGIIYGESLSYLKSHVHSIKAYNVIQADTGRLDTGLTFLVTNHHRLVLPKPFALDKNGYEFMRLVYNMNHFFTHDEISENWKFATGEYTIKRYRYDSFNNLQQSVKFSKNEKLVSKSKLHYPLEGITYKKTFLYEENQLKSVTYYHKKKPIFEEKYYYTNNRQSHYYLYKYQDGTLIPLKKIAFHYYTSEDIDSLLKQHSAN